MSEKNLQQEALELVDELNSDFGTENKWGYLPFAFESYGWQNSRITFMGVHVWDDDNDDRPYIGDTDNMQPLDEYILDESQKILMDIDISFYIKFKGVRHRKNVNKQ